jgi:hypothetical protein
MPYTLTPCAMTVSSVAQMYEQVYDMMVISIKLENPVWLDKEHNTVQSKEKAFGRQTKYFIKHPDYLIFVDEVVLLL